MADRIRIEDYVHYGQYKSPLIYHWLCMQWVDQKVNREKSFPELKGKLVILDGHWCFDREDFETVKRATREAVEERSDKFFSDIFEISEKAIQNLLSVCKEIEGRGASVENIKELFDALHKLEYPWIFTLPLSDELEDLIRAELKKQGLPGAAMQAFFEVEKPTLLMQQNDAALKIRQKLVDAMLWKQLTDVSATEAVLLIKQNNPELFKEIENHVEKFKWFGMMHFWGEPFSKEKLFEQMKGLEERKEKQAERFGFNQELFWLRKNIARLSFYRQMYADACSVASFYAVKKIDEAAKGFGSSYEQARWLSIKEFFDAMQGRGLPSQEEIKEREKAFGLIDEDKEIRIITGKELQDSIDAVLGKVSEVKEVRGMSASPGIVKGLARIILKPDEIGKVKQGDIIVASETTPDFVPAMHNAIAIVTDIGGITSHAAILSREMGIPCIVGTENATRTIKDGDLIEVNAKEGIVRIISR